MRSAMALTMIVMAALWPVPLDSQANLGTISGTVSIHGRPLAGATLALINLESGSIHTVHSGSAGAYQARVAPGDYAVSSQGPAGLAVGRGPIRLHVGAGQVALADVDLISLPVTQEPPPQAPSPQTPPVDAPAEGSVPLSDPVPVPEGAAQESPAPTDPAADGVPVDPAAGPPVVDVPAPEGGAGIKFDKVECLIAGQFPLFNAGIEPAASVARARVFFRSSQSDDWFFVEMSQTPEGAFQGKLPRPRLDASPITYYIQATTTSFVDTQSPEIKAIVVNDKLECGSLFLAPLGAPGPVQVFSASSGAAIAPAGFAAGGLLTAGLIAAIVGGAAAVGIGTVIITNPTPTPTPPTPPPPTPTPTPTPPVPPPPTPTPTPPPPPPPPPVSPIQ